MSVSTLAMYAACFAIIGLFAAGIYVLATTRPCARHDCTTAVRKPARACAEHQRPRRRPHPGNVSRLDRLDGVRAATGQQPVPRNVEEAGRYYDDLIARGEY